jgi:hypothetical protein
LTGRRSLCTGPREDASALPAKYEHHFGHKLDVRAFGFGSLRDLLAAIPALRLEPHGSRLVVRSEHASGDAEVWGDKRQRDTGPPGHSPNRDRRGSGPGAEDLDRGRAHADGRHKRSRPPTDRSRPPREPRQDRPRDRREREREPRLR